MKLNDRDIRASLKAYLENMHYSPAAIMEELHVHRGHAIADIVALHDEPHCYEIKGDNDKISRLKKQGFFYDKAFRKITLVTTNKNLSKALELCPNHWGIIIARLEENTIKFKRYKKSLSSPDYDKKIALQTLWKDEMLNIIDERNLKIDRKLNKINLAHNIATQESARNIQKSISKHLINRHIIR